MQTRTTRERMERPMLSPRPASTPLPQPHLPRLHSSIPPSLFPLALFSTWPPPYALQTMPPLASSDPWACSWTRDQGLPQHPLISPSSSRSPSPSGGAHQGSLETAGPRTTRDWSGAQGMVSWPSLPWPSRLRVYCCVLPAAGLESFSASVQAMGRLGVGQG